MTVDVCTTCLFKNDNLLITINEELFQFLLNLLQPKCLDVPNFLNQATKICYSCHERLQEMCNFRDTVLHALDSLRTQLEDDKRIKLLPPKNSPSTAVKPRTDSDHTYTVRAESPPPIVIVKTESQEGKIQDKLPKEWYIKVLTNEEILARMADKSRMPDFANAAHKCRWCVIVFKDGKEAKVHRKQCHAMSNGHFTCFICTRRFHTVTQLNRHISLHCSNVYVCAHCSFDTYDKRVIEAHTCVPTRIAVREDRPKKAIDQKSNIKGFLQIYKFVCDQCDTKFRFKRDLKEHIKIVHLEERLYKCKWCSKWFANARAMNRHLAASHGGKDRSFKCEVCGCAFTLKRILQAHMRRHTGERPYHCEYCPSTFGYNSALYRHKQALHGVSKVKAQHNATSSSSQGTGGGGQGTGDVGLGTGGVGQWTGEGGQWTGGGGQWTGEGGQWTDGVPWPQDPLSLEESGSGVIFDGAL